MVEVKEEMVVKVSDGDTVLVEETLVGDENSEEGKKFGEEEKKNVVIYFVFVILFFIILIVVVRFVDNITVVVKFNK